MKLVFRNQRLFVEATNGAISLSTHVEYIIEHVLKLGNNFGAFLNEDGHFVVASVNDHSVPGDELFKAHFCVGFDLNPSTKEPRMFFYKVIDRSLVDKIFPILVSQFGKDIVFDLDSMEFSPETIQQIFEKR